MSLEGMIKKRKGVRGCFFAWWIGDDLDCGYFHSINAAISRMAS